MLDTSRVTAQLEAARAYADQVGLRIQLDEHDHPDARLVAAYLTLRDHTGRGRRSFHG